MTGWRLIARLAFAQMKHHPGRVLTTVVGVIASTCALVWVVSGYDALVSNFDDNARKYLGRYDALIVPQGPPGTARTVEAAVVEELRRDPGVMEVNPVTQTCVTVTPVDRRSPTSETTLDLLVGKGPPVHGAPPVDPLVVSTPAVDPPYEMLEGNWLTADSSAAEAVLGHQAARRLGIEVGQRILVTSFANQVELTVVGLIDQATESPSLSLSPDRGPGPQKQSSGSRVAESKTVPVSGASDTAIATTPPVSRLRLPDAFVQGVATNAVYVRAPIAENINGFDSQPSVLQLALRDTVTTEEFREVWEGRLSACTPPLRFVDYSQVRSGVEQSWSLTSRRSQAWAATGMAALAAVFIILSTLSMGVTERSREFAVLRAVALTRSQVAGVVACESVLLAFIGWLGGLLAGAALLLAGGRVLPGLFTDGVGIGWTTIMLSGLTVVAGALGAAIVPMWRVMKIAPLEAMSRQMETPQPQRWRSLGILGLCLAALAPLIVFVLPIKSEWRLMSYSVVAYPALVLGMLLLTPIAILLCERYLGPILSCLMRLDPRLLQTQLSSNIWRTIGATLALSVGLGLYTSTQTWGHSMLQPFLPGSWVPDVLVSFHPVGLGDDGLAKVQSVTGVQSGSVLPVAIEQPRFHWPDGTAPDALKYDNAVLFGIDPQLGIAGNDPLLKLDFVDGDRESVADQLAAGGACVISEDFRMLSGITTGDELHFEVPTSDGQTVTYRVAGVVSLPGWHWITKFSGVRRNYVRTAAMMFASRGDVQRDFHLDQTEFFWLNTTPAASLATIESGMQEIAETRAGTTLEASGFGSMTAYRPSARVTATQTVRRAIRMHAGDTIEGMSYLPLVTLIIMSLAVANAMIAAVRSRTWEFGVMRSMGMTRWQLVRLVVAETLLIGAVAGVLSLVFGLTAGWSGVGMARYGGGFFAGAPVFVIPWLQLLSGFLLTLLLCLLAGSWPAIRTGRTSPLSLLQAGRNTG